MSHTRTIDKIRQHFVNLPSAEPESKVFREKRRKHAQITQRKSPKRRLKSQGFRECFGRSDRAILRVNGSALEFRHCQSDARAQPFPVLRLAGLFVQRHCSRAERRSTRRTRFRPALRVVGGKGSPSGPCSIPLGSPARRRRLHPCNVFAPVLTPHQFRVSLPHVPLGAVVETPEQVDRQIEYSRSFGGMFVAAISRVSPALSSSEARRLTQEEWKCTARESFPAEPRAMRSAKATANPLAVLPVS